MSLAGPRVNHSAKVPWLIRHWLVEDKLSNKIYDCKIEIEEGMTVDGSMI
jgi:hypothetical protein